MAETIEMRLRIVNSTGGRQLAGGDGADPHIDIEGRAVDEPWAVARAAREQLGLRIVVLRVLSFDQIEVEWLDAPDAAPPAPLYWEEAEADDVRSWWEVPGWYARTIAEADEHLVAVGLHRTGPPTHVRQNSVTGMLRMPTDDGSAVWLKAIPKMFRREPRVVQVIAGFQPQSVPEVIAVTRDWWIARELPAEAREPLGDPLITLASIQLGSLACLDSLHDAGCLKNPVTGLADDIANLVEHPALAESGLGPELRRLLPALDQICSEVDAVGIPDTVVHGDLQAANVRWTGTRWIIFDWTDATIGHPFADLGSPLAYETTEVARRRAELFAAAWREAVTDEAVAVAMAAAPTIGAAYEVINYGRIYAGMAGYQPVAGDPDPMGGLLGFWASALVESISEHHLA